MHKMVLLVAVALGLGPGCIRTKSTVELKPVEVKPIHITVDVNVRVAKELDNVFGDLDAADPTMQTGTTN